MTSDGDELSSEHRISISTTLFESEYRNRASDSESTEEALRLNQLAMPPGAWLFLMDLSMMPPRFSSLEMEQPELPLDFESLEAAVGTYVDGLVRDDVRIRDAVTVIER